MATTVNDIFCNLHGNGVEGSGDYPIINADFDITFTRTPGNSTVSWQVSNNTWNGSGTGSDTGTYGYQFWAAISLSANNVTPPTPTSNEYIIEKTTTSKTRGWASQVSLYNPSGTFTCTDKNAQIHIWVWSECYNQNAGHYCYTPHNDWVKIKSIPIVLPDYGYTVSYDTVGGFPSIPYQTKTVGTALTLSSTVPAKQFKVVYYNNGSSTPSDTANLSMTFGKWKCSADNNLYAPGSTYSVDQSCTMTAQWTATFVAIDMPDKYYRLTYNYNNGSGSPAYTDVARGSKCYVQYIGGVAHYVCDPEEEYTTSVNPTSPLELYPSYGSAAYPVSSMPVPTRSGYAFKGWYKDAELTQAIVGVIVMDSDTTIYAKWEPTTMHKYNNGWNTSSDYAWRYVDGAWHQIGHIYRYDASQSKWIDLIPAPQPATVFSSGSGLDPYYYFGMVEYHSENAAEWQVTNSSITRGHQGNSILTFGGVCDRGDFNYVCIECKTQDGNENANGVATEYNVLQLGYRWVRNGRGSHFNDWPNHSNFITHWGSKPGNITQTQVFKFDLHEIIAEPFYLELHACDIVPTIYNIWFE